jgi:pimeloyl-ACP methyl ester carboxylesterase
MANTVLRSRWVMARGVKTHYTESGGDGKVLVALHGGGAGSSGVAGMGLVMEKLADDFRCIAPDSIGGFGLTDPYAKAPHGLNSRAEHTADVIDALCLDKITILGNSQGAFTAAQYALTHPERVEKMILVSSLTIANAFGIKQAPNFQAFGAAIARMRDDPLMALQVNMKDTLPILAKYIPTIFLWGDSDPFAIPETGRALEKMLPNVKFHWVPGAGHQVQTDKPDESAKIIRAFINS